MDTKTPAQIAEELNAIDEHQKKVDEIKKKHKVDEVFELCVGDAVAYLRKPNRKDISMSRTIGEGDYIVAQETLLDSIWLEGDERIRQNDDYFLNALPTLEKLIEAKKVELKKN